MPRPIREPTTVIVGRAMFDGYVYTVYAKKGTRIRTIFPRPEYHPAFQIAPFGARFEVWYRGHRYWARKEARWQENGARVPCLTWEVG